MLSIMEQLTSWHWLTLGLILLIMEALGTGGFLLGGAVSAFVLGVLMQFFPDIYWHQQLVIFAVLASVFSVLYWKYFKKFNETTDEPLLNNKVGQMVGKKLRLQEAIVGGEGKIQIGDTFWKLHAETDLEEACDVVVVGYEGTTLIVEPC